MTRTKYSALRESRPKRVEVLTREVQGDLLAYDARTGRAHCLNKSAAIVWLACDGNATVAEITNQLATRPGLSEAFVYVALAELDKAELLQASGVIVRERSRKARREVLQRIGAAATLALPLVTSLLIPTPAAAASCFPLAHPCSSGVQCCSGHCGLSGINLVCLP